MLEAGALLDMAGAIAALGVGGLARSLSQAPRWRQIRLVFWVGATGGSYFLLDLHTSIAGVPGLWRATLNGLDLSSLALHIGCWIALRPELAAQPGETIRRRDTLDRIVLGMLGLTAIVCAIPGLAFIPGEVLRSAGIGTMRYFDVTPTSVGDVAFAVLLVTMGITLARYTKDRKNDRVDTYYVAALALLFVGALHDILVSAGTIAPPYLAGAFFLAELVFLRAALMRRFVATANALDRLALDLEERVKERTAALERATDTLRRTERLATLGQLAGGVAHEINNPIAAVIGNLTVLEESAAAQMKEEDLACLTDSLAAARRVARIVRQLQQAGARTRTGDTRVTIDVTACVRAAVDTARASVKSTAVVDVQCPDGTFAIGERTMLEQVVTNLVTNALQAISDDRTDGRVTVHVETTGGKVTISVTDNGAGMSAATRERLFEPFFSTKPAGVGTGLGLAVSSTFVSAMRGELRVESTEGKGATFTIELDAAEKPGPTNTVPPAPEIKRRRLLLVDDDAQVLATHARQLRGHYDVEVASSVDAALARIALGGFDAVVCDLTMPGGGGERLLRDLRTNGSPLADRTLLITGGARSAADDDLMERMGSRVLSKPCSRAELVLAIESVLPR